MNCISKRLVLLTVFITSSISATTINVPADSATIQAAINGAVNGDTVLVQPGTYVENINFNGKNIVIGSLYLTSGDTAYIAQTIIDGDSSGTVVTFESGEDSAAVLSGLTITNGFNTYGGGINSSNSSPTLTNLLVAGNVAVSAGTGINLWRSSGTKISNCTITGNSSIEGGGGVYFGESDAILTNSIVRNNLGVSGAGIVMWKSAPIIRDVLITENQAIHDGGGMVFWESTPVIENSTFSFNSATEGEGGAIAVQDSSFLVLTNSVVSNNSAVSGGGIHVSLSDVKISYCTFQGNESPTGHAGGILIKQFSSAVIENTTITGNVGLNGGGLHVQDNASEVILINCTVSGNSAAVGAGITIGVNSNRTIINSIFWDNSSRNIYLNSGATITIVYSNIMGGWEGLGNIAADPLFVDPAQGDFSLQESSLCIDAGNPDTLYNDPEDPANPGYALWPALGTVRNDMGAYGGNPSLPSSLSVDDEPAATMQLPIGFALHQNYPNPFNPTSTIQYDLPKAANVTLVVYDILGREVVKLVDQEMQPGYHRAVWDARDRSGRSMPTGIYIARLSTPEYTKFIKMLLLK